MSAALIAVLLLVVGGGVAGASIAAPIVAWSRDVRIRKLEKELRLRQLYLEARRWELATLLRLWTRWKVVECPPGNHSPGDTTHRKAFVSIGVELGRQAAACGLTPGGGAVVGCDEPRALWPAEFAELAELAGVPGVAS